MKFKINNRNWEILEMSQKDMAKEMDKDYDPRSSYFGITVYHKQIIALWEESHIEQKRQTLLHELMHCYIGMYCDFDMQEKSTEEYICNVSANSHDIIHEIVEKYFKE